MPVKTQTLIGLSGNQLKLIALICMTFDHVGMELLPQFRWLRMIGRLAFPIFAYMIAEGCRHTKHRWQYLLTMAAFALLCQIGCYFAEDSLYQCVLVTFTLSILMIYALENALQKRTVFTWAMAVLAFAAVWFVCQVLPRLLPGTDFKVDYGFFGALLPVVVYLGRSKGEKLALATVVMALISLNSGSIQWVSLLSVFLLALYNGQRGTLRLKNLFYIYYPLHLAVIWLIRRVL